MLRKLLTNRPKIPVSKKNLKRFPQSPGVYLFLTAGKPIYIGKAVNLKSRVSSYFQKNLGVKTQTMVGSADSLSFIPVESELESLLLEAELIRKYQPIYNSVAKDDKHALYIKISKDTYPKVITARKIDNQDTLAFFGPFPSSGQVREVLRFLRKTFPYADHKPGKRKCLMAHIGLCAPCPSEIENKNPIQKKLLKRIYLKNIKMIRNVMSRNTNTVSKYLYKQMSKYAKAEKFEDAAKVREQIKRLEYILQPINPARGYLKNPNMIEDI